MNPQVCLALLVIFFGSFFPLPLAAESSLQLVEIFSVGENPGSGTLSYKTSAATEKIVFGKETGYYGLGMVFGGNVLPEPYRNEFKTSQILQIALGTLKGKNRESVPQFGAATLVTTAIPTATTVFRLIVPNGKESQTDNAALLLFTSPTTRNDQSDEEKLKSTYFAKSGTIIVTPLETVQPVSIGSQGKKVSFNRQLMKLDFEATLTTPFNTAENTLSGSVTFPVFWANGKAAQTLANRIATESLNPGSNIATNNGDSTVTTGKEKRKPASKSSKKTK